MSGQFFGGRFSRASGDGDDGFVPFEINAVREALESENRVFDEKKFVFELFEFRFVFFKTVVPDNGGNRAFFKRRRDVFGRVFKITVKAIIFIFGLRKRKKDIARFYFARVNRESFDLRCL